LNIDPAVIDEISRIAKHVAITFSVVAYIGSLWSSCMWCSCLLRQRPRVHSLSQPHPRPTQNGICAHWCAVRTRAAKQRAQRSACHHHACTRLKSRSPRSSRSSSQGAVALRPAYKRKYAHRASCITSDNPETATFCDVAELVEPVSRGPLRVLAACAATLSTRSFADSELLKARASGTTTQTSHEAEF
jgi:hypothetical protein